MFYQSLIFFFMRKINAALSLDSEAVCVLCVFPGVSVACTLAPKHILKSCFISDTVTLSCGRLGPLQQGTTVLRSNSTTCVRKNERKMNSNHPETQVHFAERGSDSSD